VHRLGARGSGGATPRSLIERCARGGHGGVDIGVGAHGRGAERLFGGRLQS